MNEEVERKMEMSTQKIRRMKFKVGENNRKCLKIFWQIVSDVDYLARKFKYFHFKGKLTRRPQRTAPFSDSRGGRPCLDFTLNGKCSSSFYVDFWRKNSNIFAIL